MSNFTSCRPLKDGDSTITLGNLSVCSTTFPVSSLYLSSLRFYYQASPLLHHLSPHRELALVFFTTSKWTEPVIKSFLCILSARLNKPNSITYPRSLNIFPCSGFNSYLKTLRKRSFFFFFFFFFTRMDYNMVFFQRSKEI